MGYRNVRQDAADMVDEGGLGVEAHYQIRYKGRKQSEELRAAKAMIDEGGLGAEIYYDEEEKIAFLDIEQNEDGYVS